MGPAVFGGALDSCRQDWTHEKVVGDAVRVVAGDGCGGCRVWIGPISNRLGPGAAERVGRGRIVGSHHGAIDDNSDVADNSDNSGVVSDDHDSVQRAR